MPTTQSEDPGERVNHPRHYNAHASNIECIELIEHLPCNLSNAVKYIWRCGLKQTETPLRDLQSARWYTEREDRRIFLFELDDEPRLKTDVVWRSLAHQVIAAEQEGSLLREYLDSLLVGKFGEMLEELDFAIAEEMRASASR
jgi:hypothetical protein